MARNLRPETFRSRSNLAAAGLSELAAPLLRLACKIRAKSHPSAPETWKRAALVGAAHIGDVLYNSGSLPALKEAFPQCDWFYICSPPASDVLANNPNIAGCFESLAAASDLDAVICYNSSSYWRQLLEAISLGIANRAGYVHKGFSGLVTHPISIKFPQPYPAYFRDLVGQLTGSKPDWSLRPQVFPTDFDRHRAREFLQTNSISADDKLVCCFVTTRQPQPSVPADAFAEALAIVERESRAKTLLCGAKSEAALLRDLKARHGLRAAIVAGELDLLTLTCVLEYSAVVLSPDSGPRHLANAVNTPVVFFRNLGARKIETGAYLEKETDVAPDVECVSAADLRDGKVSFSPRAMSDPVMRRL